MPRAIGIAVSRQLCCSRARAAVAAAWLALAVAGGEPLAGRQAPGPWPEFVEIPAGPFTMGADPARDAQAFDNERWSPAEGVGAVDLPAFSISRHEVTVAQFAAFVRASTWKADPRALAGAPTHPVTFVSWPDALAYARWLQAAMARDAGAPAAVRARLAEGWRMTLPTEAQWEKAARGTDGRRFPWGDEPRRDRANVGGSGTMPVGSFPCPECPYGLADMSGNVWEWTASPNQPYPFTTADDRANLDADALWIMRGGHFGDPPRLVRTTTRGAADPGARRPFIGFRVALVPPGR
ncbi:MAG: SUMF1/EgtB/PvdO family nonheme iron enzyme [Acidobacteriota bacterium]